MKELMVTFAIPVLNGEETLEKCLKSIRMQTYPQHQVEIIIADGGSTDKTVNIAKKYDTRIYPNPDKLAHWGDKITAKEAKGELFVVFAADNELPDRNALEHLVELFQRDQNLACCWGPMISGPEDNSINRYYELIKSDPLCFFLNKNLDGYLKTTRQVEVNGHPVFYFDVLSNRPLVWGANGLVFRTAYVRHIFTKPEFIGDNDVYQQMVEEGHHRVAYSLGWRTIHHHVQRLDVWASKWRRDFLKHSLSHRTSRNMNWAFDRHFNLKLSLWIFYTAIFPISCLHALYLAIKTKRIEWMWHPVAGLIQLGTYLWTVFFTHQGRSFLSSWIAKQGNFTRAWASGNN
jgi:glycosyltransferase involved in cell wall biosynthesis